MRLREFDSTIILCACRRRRVVGIYYYMRTRRRVDIYNPERTIYFCARARVRHAAAVRWRGVGAPVQPMERSGMLKRTRSCRSITWPRGETKNIYKLISRIIIHRDVSAEKTCCSSGQRTDVVKYLLYSSPSHSCLRRKCVEKNKK